MKTYIVTAGLKYYPIAGIGDWIFVTHQEHEAHDRIAELKLEAPGEYDWYMIIMTDGETGEYYDI